MKNFYIAFIALNLLLCTKLSFAQTNKVLVGGKEYSEKTTYTGTATSFTGRGDEGYCVGYYISNDTILSSNSLLVTNDSAVSSLSLKLTALDTSSTSNIFNSVIATGSGTYITLTDSISVLDNSDGSVASDFSALGTAILSTNYATVYVDSMEIYTEGFVRAAFITDSHGQIIVKGSKLTTMGANPLTESYSGYSNSANQSAMISSPWVLGIQGGSRTANVLGNNSSLTFIGSEAIAGGWGILSTDACSNVVVNVVDSKLEILPESEGGMSSGNFSYSSDYGSGYGSYITGDANEYFYGTELTGLTYASILTGGNAYYKSSNDSITLYDGDGETIETIAGQGNPTTINSVFGFMAHNNGSINVLDNTVVNSEEAIFLYKDGNVDFVADEASLNSASGIILQMIDNDDATVGNTNMVFNTTFSEDEGWPSENGNVTSSAGSSAVTLSLTKGDYIGDVLNGTGYYTQTGDALTVTIGEDATLTGAISLTETRHIDENGDQNTEFTINEYYYLGHVENRNYSNGNSSIAVSLSDNSIWKVTSESYISSLYVADGCEITDSTGSAGVIMTVDGDTTTIVAGTEYSGEIIITPDNSSDVEVSSDIAINNTENEIRVLTLENSLLVQLPDNSLYGKNLKINIITTNGKTVYTTNRNVTTDEFSVPVSGLSQGIYLVQIISENSLEYCGKVALTR